VSAATKCQDQGCVPGSTSFGTAPLLATLWDGFWRRNVANIPLYLFTSALRAQGKSTLPYKNSIAKICYIGTLVPYLRRHTIVILPLTAVPCSYTHEQYVTKRMVQFAVKLGELDGFVSKMGHVSRSCELLYGIWQFETCLKVMISNELSIKNNNIYLVDH
jgi:hypothetical protein